MHRFDLVISGPPALITRGTDASWGEENDVWLEKVAASLICEYYVDAVVGKGQETFLVPRPGPSYCP